MAHSTTLLRRNTDKQRTPADSICGLLAIRSHDAQPREMGGNRNALKPFGVSAYIRTRSAVGEADWCCMTELQHADLICCEMYRLTKIGPDGEAEAPPPKQEVPCIR